MVSFALLQWPGEYLLFLIFLFGLLVGSFLNVCIYRLPRGESIVWPRSRCVLCGSVLPIYDLIPLLSYWLRAGKCRYCGQPISLRYCLVELLTAVLFTVCLATIGASGYLLDVLVFVSSLLIIAFVDYEHQIIPDKLLLAMAVYTGFILLASAEADIADRVTAGLAGGAFMLFIAFLSKGGMGGGDVKLSVVLGLWLGMKLLVLSLFIAFLAGGAAGSILLLLHRKRRKDAVPFGPFLAFGGVISILLSEPILSAYWRLFR